MEIRLLIFIVLNEVALKFLAQTKEERSISGLLLDAVCFDFKAMQPSSLSFANSVVELGNDLRILLA